MYYLNTTSAFVGYWLSAAADAITRWTGCNQSSGDACTVWRGTVNWLRHDPLALWIFAGLIALMLAVALLRRLIQWAKNGYTDWKDDWGRPRWMRAYEAFRAGLLNSRGFLIGDFARGMILPLRYVGEASILTFGGAGSGKGAGIVIPNCLLHQWQVIVDWGAEIVTACLKTWCAKGIRVVVVNPCRVFTLEPWSLPVDRFNPMAGIDPSQPGFGAKCRALAESMYIRTGNEADSFWIDSAVGVTDFCARHVILKGDRATLIDVYRAILSGFANQERFFTEMSQSDDEFIRDAGGRMLALIRNSPRTASGIIQQIETRLAWMADDRFVESLSGHDVDFDELRGIGRGQKGCVIVFILPPNLASSHAAWLKVCLNCVTSAMYDEIPKNRVLMTIDEAAVLGNWSQLEQIMANMRRYRMQLHLVYQSMGQPVELFGGLFQSMMNNAEVKNFVGACDELTAKFLSQIMGGIIEPELFQRMGRGRQFTLVRHERPIVVDNRPYFHRASMRKEISPTPYHPVTPRLPGMYPIMVIKGLLVRLYASARPTTRQAVLMSLVTVGFFWGRTAWSLF